jgi:hypothetical protein
MKTVNTMLIQTLALLTAGKELGDWGGPCENTQGLPALLMLLIAEREGIKPFWAIQKGLSKEDWFKIKAFIPGSAPDAIQSLSSQGVDRFMALVEISTPWRENFCTSEDVLERLYSLCNEGGIDYKVFLEVLPAVFVGSQSYGNRFVNRFLTADVPLTAEKIAWALGNQQKPVK